MITPKVSVIVPIYNAEHYIERCADSLFKQTLLEMEYVFVDDCSTDGSIAVLENTLNRYPERIANTKIIKLASNSGAAVARREGILNATGEYTIHCDSDDWVDIGMYEEMYNYAVEGGYDMVWCDINCTDGEKVLYYSYQECEPEKFALIKGFLVGQLGATTPNRLCRRSLYTKDFIFPVGCMTEDLVIVSQLVLNSAKIGHIRKPYYFYYYNANSITKRSDKLGVLRRFNDSIANFNIVIRVLDNHHLLNRYADEVMLKKIGCKNMLIPVLTTWADCKLWASTYPECNLKLFVNRYVGLKTKLRSLLILLRMYPLCRKLL
jgi:glycosyltransferase involved in cell wall biosynthesis